MHPILSSPCVCLCFFVCTITFRTKCIKFHCIYHLVDVRNSFCLQQQQWQWQCQPLQNNVCDARKICVTSWHSANKCFFHDDFQQEEEHLAR